MNLKVTISVGDFSNISILSNEHTSLSECAKEIIRELSKIDGDFHIDTYIRAYLIPIAYRQEQINKITEWRKR